jgi:hypothetical protein
MTASSNRAQLLRRIEQLCEHFERAWRQGYQPQLETYLSAIDEVDRPALLHELLLLDVDYRRAQGHSPAEGDYFPALAPYADVVSAALAASHEAHAAQHDRPVTIAPTDPRHTPTAVMSTMNPGRGTSLGAKGRPPRVTIDIIAGSAAGAKLELHGDDSVLVGRDSTCHLVLKDDEDLSRFHCLLEIRLPACYIRDLNSRTGTWVNGQKIGGIATLSDGDVVACGQTHLKMRIAGAVGRQATPTRRGASLHPRPASQTGGQLPPDSDLEHGKLFFPGYELVRKLGKGGMGLVYQAKEVATGRPVALKVIVPEWAFDEEASRRFLREVSAIARLRHRRIVEFLEAGWIEGHLFLAMEFVEQIDLHEELSRRAPASRIKVASGLACQVLEGLRYAHGQSWVHRDLKPANVLVGRFEGRLRAKIADFGLAKNAGLGGHAGMTQSGQMLGTLPFMAPEQFENARDVTPSMDIYSLGATFYYWLTQQAPVKFEKGKNTTNALLNEQPTPIWQLAPDVPQALGEIIHKALAKNPADRFESADAMWKKLAPFAKGEGSFIA